MDISPLGLSTMCVYGQSAENCGHKHVKDPRRTGALATLVSLD